MNALNQYTSRDIPGVAETHGYADTNTLVWVNGIEPLRQWDYFWQEFGVNNMFAGVFTNLETITVDAASTNVFDNVNYVQKSPETFQYDLDGNLIQDGQWSYTWDAENRLIHMENLSVIPAELRLSLNFAYDWQGRRIAKTVCQNGTVTSDRRFYYDGWNLTGEVDLVSGLSLGYTWGLDLSQSRQGAGGVGGLLAISVASGELAGTYATAYDGNGNIIALVNTADGTIAAQYEYGPFGELISATGPMATINPFGFSTKYRDGETGLICNQHRYSKNLGWINRDPVGEQGGMNLYVVCDNDQIGCFDPTGLSKTKSDFGVSWALLTHYIFGEGLPLHAKSAEWIEWVKAQPRIQADAAKALRGTLKRIAREHPIQCDGRGSFGETISTAIDTDMFLAKYVLNQGYLSYIAAWSRQAGSEELKVHVTFQYWDEISSKPGPPLPLLPLANRVLPQAALTWNPLQGNSTIFGPGYWPNESYQKYTGVDDALAVAEIATDTFNYPFELLYGQKAPVGLNQYMFETGKWEGYYTFPKLRNWPF